MNYVHNRESVQITRVLVYKLICNCKLSMAWLRNLYSQCHVFVDKTCRIYVRCMRLEMWSRGK